jgi:hypothetical protein
VVNQAVDSVTLGEALALTVLVLPNAAFEIIGHSGVEDDPADVRHHIDIVGFHDAREVSRRAAPARDDRNF